MDRAIVETVGRCYQCGVCSGSCPVVKVRKEFSPRRILMNMSLGNASKVISSGVLWNCLTCGTCEVKCPMDVDFLELVKDLRTLMLKEEVFYNPSHEGLLGPLYNILKDEAMNPRRKALLAEGVRIDDDSDTLYFVGCLPYMDVIFKDDLGFEGLEIANNNLRLLNAIGIEPAIADEEKCCGHDFLWRGRKEFFAELGRQNESFLKQYERIVVSCPECYRTLAIDYKEELGIKLNVVHISELLAESVDELDFLGTADDVTFHDSCRLGRYMGVYDAPRDLLGAAGHKVREMMKNREESLCCGISAFISCNDKSKEIRRGLMKEALETGAKTLVTSCPKCQIHLKCLQNDESEPEYEIRIADLSTVVLESLKGEVEA
jgi:Fe-S oxidoreductase